MQTIANRVQLIGRLGMDPEVRELKNSKMLRMSIATDASYRDKEGNRIQDTHWHTVVAWNKTAELGAKLFKKGKQVCLEGSLINRSYQDKDGNKKFATEVRVERFLLLGKKDD